jgi:hypothetical protein
MKSWNSDFVAVQPCLAFNYGEFAIIKVRIVDSFPDSKKLHCVPVAQPVGNEKIAIFGLQHVSQRNKILVFVRNHRDGCSLDLNGVFSGLIHISL